MLDLIPVQIPSNSLSFLGMTENTALYSYYCLQAAVDLEARSAILHPAVDPDQDHDLSAHYKRLMVA